MKNIIILNGAAKKNGHTAGLIEAFSEGAKSAGNSVKEFYLQGMEINGCLDCGGCLRRGKDAPRFCVQQDDMQQIYQAFVEADVIVFASPVYWWEISGLLKTAVDRLYALTAKDKKQFAQKGTVLLMTAGTTDYSYPLAWYAGFERYLGCKNLGTVLGSEKTEAAKALGASIS